MRKGNPISMWWETEIRWCIFFFKAFKLNRTIVGYYHLGSAVAVTVLSLEAHCTTVIPISFVCFRRFLFPFLSLCHFFSINQSWTSVYLHHTTQSTVSTLVATWTLNSLTSVTYGFGFELVGPSRMTRSLHRHRRCHTPSTTFHHSPSQFSEHTRNRIRQINK